MALLLKLGLLYPAGVDGKLANSRRCTWCKPVSEGLAPQRPRSCSGVDGCSDDRLLQLSFPHRAADTAVLLKLVDSETCAFGEKDGVGAEAHTSPRLHLMHMRCGFRSLIRCSLSILSLCRMTTASSWRKSAPERSPT